MSLLQNCSCTAAVFETDTITNLFSDSYIHLFGNMARNRHNSHPTRLGARNHHLLALIWSCFYIDRFQNELGNLSGFATTSLTD